ncbi:hypothetical protein BH10BAC3_BH10BAC3_10260 [soil metagenome]
MKTFLRCAMFISAIFLNASFCKAQSSKKSGSKSVTAKYILGNPKYLAMSYGAYRELSQDIEPTITQLKEDMKILAAMKIKLLRTYNVERIQVANVLEAIHQLKSEDSNFEMYVMLGAWIDCKNARTDTPDHEAESEKNAGEIERAVALAKKYPGIVKIIAVGNEAMVKWAASYYVQPGVILKWVNHLQDLKKKNELSKDLWITSSDNFASWGGGGNEYHVKDLEQLMKSVDFISMHTYPMHDTHYNPKFWGVMENEKKLSDIQKINACMLRAKEYSVAQYERVVKYMKSLKINKPIHIGETGWASVSDGFYGATGSKATDEYKEGIYYRLMRDWTNKKGLSCFYFEAFDEQWKSANNPNDSENHFGLIKLNGEVKYALWNLVDGGAFKGLTRNGKALIKSYAGNKKALLKEVLTPITIAKK